MRDRIRIFWSEPRARFNAGLLIFGLALTSLGGAKCLWGPPSHQSLWSVLLGMGGSFLSFGLLESILKASEVHKEQERKSHFIDFFGKPALDPQGFWAVFNSSELPPFSGNAKGKLSNMITSEMPKNAKRCGAWPKGIAHIVSLEDLQAVLDIDREFRKFGCMLVIKRDEYAQSPPPHGCLAIGLGFNNVTTWIMEASDGLFEIFYENQTDDFVLGKRSDPNHFSPKSSPCDDYSLFARVLITQPQDTEPVPYLVCAGHTASATVLAARYLANNWPRLAAIYQEGKSKRDLKEWNMAVVLRWVKGQIVTPTAKDAKFLVPPVM